MPRTVSVVAPAKVNLYLGVGAQADDGYHEVTTIMHALELHDEITIAEAPELSIECAPDLGIPAERNLAYRAATELADALGHEAAFAIRVTKRIPHAAGLGGGSSDAAAVIAGLAHVWGVDKLDPRCLAVAARLGADVPFFLYGGAALMTGRGDEISQALPARDFALVLVRPDVPASTAEVYRAFDASPSSAAGHAAVVEALMAGDAALLGERLANNLSEAACAVAPPVAEVLGWLSRQQGVLGAQVSGSGSAVFGVVGSAEIAEHIAREAAGRGWWATPTKLSAQGATVTDEKGRA